MRPWLDLFRARLREPADLTTLVHELEQIVRAVVQPANAVFWSPPDIAQHWTDPGNLPAYTSDDPLVTWAIAYPTTRLRAQIPVNSPALAALDAGVVVPLVSLGTFVGLIAIPAPALSADQIATLDEIAGLAAPAIRVARLAHRVDLAERAHETTTEELRVAEIIQRSLLPESLPNIAGWRLDAWYKPARVVGGDLYDILPLPGDLLGIVLGDASDKSVPAALVMATVRTLIRAAAQRVILPGQVLARANDDLCAQIPPGMFVTCFFAILDTSSGRFRFANAGQCAPNLCGPNGVEELSASGWPLGMLPGRTYDEGEITLTPGSTVICFSDGLTETHDPAGEMFGTNRITATIAEMDNCAPLIPALLAVQQEFAGPSWEQEDDVTLISVTRLPDPEPIQEEAPAEPETISVFSVPSAPDTERVAADQVLVAVAGLPLTDSQRQRLFTATAETVMNAAEHGNHYRQDLSVGIEVIRHGNRLHVRISDGGRGGAIPEVVTPNIDAKLAGLQSPRGWGLFLIEKMVDQVEVLDTPTGHTVELTVILSEEHADTET